MLTEYYTIEEAANKTNIDPETLWIMVNKYELMAYIKTIDKEWYDRKVKSHEGVIIMESFELLVDPLPITAEMFDEAMRLAFSSLPPIHIPILGGHAWFLHNA